MASNAPSADTKSYVPFFTIFSVTIAVLTRLASRRPAPPRSPLELFEAMLATFFITRVIARERVGAVFREPFVEPAPGADPGDSKGEAKQPTGRGVRRSAGELVTCPRCLGPWAAALVTYGGLFAPGPARILTRVLALAGANSFAHASHSAACALSNTLDPDH